MLGFILWYLVITLIGWIAFPLAFRLLPKLPDRGYTLARALGWLVWGYLFWLMVSFRIGQNDVGGLLLAAVLLAGLSAWALSRPGTFQEIQEWIKNERRLVISAELVFLVAFAAWAFVRAANPEIIGTEKPMEMAFINAILKSPAFPPNDPWLSGFAISYYYFGYVLVAMLIQLTGTASGVAFNLAVALIFGLTALGAYGLIYNLLHIWKPSGEKSRGGLTGLPLLGPLFILIVSNVEGFLEILHARGIFWRQAADGTLQSPFWTWLDLQELNLPPAEPFSLAPNRPAGTLWWRASRVLSDYNFNRDWKEIIDEFPFFSYLLADLHPHVLAMPFALLVVSLALNLFLNREEKGFQVFGLEIPLSKPFFLLSALSLGGLAFLNTWDFPIYVALFCGAFALRRVFEAGWSWQRLGDFIRPSLAIGVAGILLYLPFYVGFSSQAGGILPSLIFHTRGIHLWIMFAPLLIPVFALLIYMARSYPRSFQFIRGLIWAAILVGALWIGSYLLGAGISLITLNGLDVGRIFLDNQGAVGSDIGILLSVATGSRIVSPGAWITLLLVLALVFALLPPRAKSQSQPEAAPHTEIAAVETPKIQPVYIFILGMTLVGALLVLGPEFFYLRDQFGTRMNTIFKFYFQAWILWGLVAAFGVAVLLQALGRISGLLLRVGLLALLGVSLAYPAYMLWYKTDGFRPAGGLTLDGTAGIARYNPDEMAAIRWLARAPSGVVAEAVGGSYSGFARYSTNTGVPTVLGWPGHESQWRGGGEGLAERETDVFTLYRTGNWPEAEEILKRYQIRYVIVGDLERSTYRVNDSKFQSFLTPVFETDTVVIYEYSGAASGSETAMQ